MNRYKMEAMRKQISDLNRGIASCSKTTDPSKCKNQIQKKILKTKAKLGEI